MVGSFIVGVSIVQDFTRYSKTVKDSSIGIVLGFTIGYPAVVICGAIFACAFQSNDLTNTLINVLGFGYIAAFIIVIATWTTNDNNLYQSVLGLTNACHGTIKLPSWVTTAICGSNCHHLGRHRHDRLAGSFPEYSLRSSASDYRRNASGFLYPEKCGQLQI